VDLEGCDIVSKFNAILITKDQDWSERFKDIEGKHQLDLTVTPEWKKTIGNQQHYHYYFVDVDSVEYPNQLQFTSSSYVIGLSRTADFDQTREWLTAGAKDLVVFPKEQNRLEDLIRESKQQIQFHRETEIGYGSGEVHAFYSAKGGSGKTLLAAMMGQSLSVHHGQKVLIVDLNAQFGNIDSLFGLQPPRSYYDLIPVMDEMEMRHLQNIAIDDEENGVTIITGPSNPARAEEISDELIAKLIRVARSHYDYIILDLPSTINSITFTGLSEATRIHYVLTPDSLGMRCYKYANELFERFQLGVNGTLSIVLNRTHPKSELHKKDIEKIIAKTIDGTISADFLGIQPYMNMGVSFFKKKKDKGSSKTSKDMKKYVEETINQEMR
jgi:pilus assembly protein CpaE